MIALLTEGLTAELSYGYMDSEFDEYNARNPATNQIEDISDITTVTRAPENTASLGLQYTFQPTDLGALSARVDFAYTDGYTFHPFLNEFDRADSRTLVNARITLDDLAMGKDSTLRLSAWAKNLTDEEYREWGIDFGTLGFAGATYGRPRTFGIDAVYNF